MMVFSPRGAEGERENEDVLARELNVSPLLAQLLCVRGYDSPEAARRFLQPELGHLHDPFLFPQMQDAVDCILAAGSMGLGICVFGDYDCDGVCATAILTRFLRSLDFNVMPYIPVRSEEGYGLNREALEKLADMGVELLITVDCGISAAEEIAYAYELGMEVLVTDHHQCPSVLPECEAIINPAMGEGYPFSSLCGAGVAFKIVQAIGGLEAALPYIDIAAIATVADIVDLQDENRVLVTEGIRVIRAGECHAGPLALMEEAGVDRAHLEASHIAFGLAPRINAMGRTGCAEDSLLLFLTDDPKEAATLSRSLGKENQNRQQIEREILEDAEKKIRDGEADPAREQALLLAGEDWNSGVIGIVASRLVKRYHRPVLLFAGNGDFWTASGRSVEGVHLFDALSAFAHYFERFGGHAMAAGLTIRKDRFQAFKEEFLAYAQSIPSEHLMPRASYDLQLKPEAVDDRLVTELAHLAPFGAGNPSPVLYIADVRADSPRTMGQENQHLRFQLGNLECVAFGSGHEADSFRREALDLLVEAEHNTFGGRTRIQARVREWRCRAPEEINRYLDGRRDEFYDALLGRMGYNKEAGPTEAWEAEFVSYGEEELRSRVLAAFSEALQGTAVLLFSPQGAEGLMGFLRENQSLERVDLHWRELADPVAYNCVVFAPDFDCCDFSGMDRVICWDGPFDGPALNCLAALKKDRREGLALWKGPGGDPGWLKELHISREELIPIYKGMLFLARQRQSFSDRAAYEKALMEQQKLGLYPIKLALAVFSELEFLKVEDAVPFRVTANEKPAQRGLEESNVYFSVQNAYGDYAARWGKK